MEKNYILVVDEGTTGLRSILYCLNLFLQESEIGF
jgi:sugar (pentulose or hexulose) kinase